MDALNLSLIYYRESCARGEPEIEGHVAPTTRLSEILKLHPLDQSLPSSPRPSKVGGP